MYKLPAYLIIIFSLIIAIPVSRLLVNQIGKFVSKKTKPFLYLIIAAIPIYEIIRLMLTFSNFHLILFFYFWVLFLAALIILFIIELNK